MCLAVPMKLVERSGSEGVVELDGVRRTISLALLPDAEAGDHVLVHAGYAIGKVDEREAREILDLFRRYAEQAPGETGPGTAGEEP